MVTLNFLPRILPPIALAVAMVPWLGCAADHKKVDAGATGSPSNLATPEFQDSSTLPTNHRIRRLPPVEPAWDQSRDQKILTVSFEQQDQPAQPIPDPLPDQPRLVAPPKSDKPLQQSERNYPIDLANALALGGANNLQIQLARMRVVEAEANYNGARAMWLPSLRFGIGYNKHDGRLQETEGGIIEANRNSLFVGGGAGLGGASLAGGSGGPSRLVMNLSLADAAFEPLVARQMFQAEQFAQDAAFNDSLLQIALAYFDLVEAHGTLSNAMSGRTAAEHMVKLTRDFKREGFSSETELSRAHAERTFWQQRVEDAHRRTTHRSAELVRLLHLDAHLVLVPVEDKVLPIELIDPSSPMEALLAQGLENRPEMTQYAALVDASIERMNQEHWRPWLPSVQVGVSAGSFGGGESTVFRPSAGRSDVDLSVVWELRNLGFGNASQRLKRDAQFHQIEHQTDMVRDKISAEIVSAFADVTSYKKQMKTAKENITASEKSYQLNAKRIHAGEGIPIELIQAIRARTSAQDASTKAVSDYNRAQYNLLRALGQPPGAPEKKMPEK